MRTLEHHTAISQSMLIVQSRLVAIQRIFETFGKTPIDESLIDLLSSQAQDMLAYAQFLKTVEPAPPVVEPEPESPDTGDEGDPGDAEPQP
jgi:hypothetical protein